MNRKEQLASWAFMDTEIAPEPNYADLPLFIGALVILAAGCVVRLVAMLWRRG